MELLLKADMLTRQRFVHVKRRDFGLELLNGISATLTLWLRDRNEKLEHLSVHLRMQEGRLTNA